MITKQQRARRRAARTRYTLSKRNKGLLRLSVFRSNRQIYAQIIDDKKAVTLVSASSRDKTLRASLPRGNDKEAARAIGLAIGQRAVAQGIKSVVFDRGAYQFHGRVRELAEGARAAGLQF